MRLQRWELAIGTFLVGGLTLAQSTDALVQAITKGDSPTVLKLLASGVPVNPERSEAPAPIDMAAWVGRCDLIEPLIEYGAVVNPDPAQRTPPLFLAAAAGHIQCVHVLLAHAAEVDVRATVYRKDGWNTGELLKFERMTPLMLAAREGKTEVVGLLLDRRADVNARNDRDLTAIYFAAYNNHPDTVDLLIKAGSDSEAIWEAQVVAKSVSKPLWKRLRSARWKAPPRKFPWESSPR